MSLFEAFGNTNANLSLATRYLRVFGAIAVAALLFIPRGILKFRDFMTAS